jgi:CRP-like cAMP-binding protein
VSAGGCALRPRPDPDIDVSGRLSGDLRAGYPMAETCRAMALRRDAKIDLLRNVPMFEHVSRRELARIAALAVEVSYPQGVPLLRKGSRDDGFFILLNGEVDVRQGARLLATLKRGQFFGEIGLLAGITRSATVTTGTPVDVLRISGADFRKLLKESPTLALRVLEAVADRLQAAIAGYI